MRLFLCLVVSVLMLNGCAANGTSTNPDNNMTQKQVERNQAKLQAATTF